MKGTVCNSALALCVLASATHAQSSPTAVPFTRGLAIVQTLHVGDAERESVVMLLDVSPKGVRYEWTLEEVHSDGDTIRDKAQRFVSASDLAAAPQWREYFEKGEKVEQPGYTAWTVSSSVYEQLRTTGVAPYAILTKEYVPGGAAFGRMKSAAVRWRGKLSRVGTNTESFPLLLNAQRIQVPALHVRGDFTGRGKAWTPDLWILADRANPLILKLSDKDRVFQTVRVVLDNSSASVVEAPLLKTCRAEVPGIFFAFNSATIDPASDNTIASLAGVLSRHPTWDVTIEGHTDSIGSAKSNQLLSERRSQAVRERLVTRHNTPAASVRAVGYGATKPRETNTTIEGRARNRRVEIIRPCGGATR